MRTVEDRLAQFRMQIRKERRNNIFNKIRTKNHLTKAQDAEWQALQECFYQQYLQTRTDNQNENLQEYYEYLHQLHLQDEKERSESNLKQRKKKKSVSQK